jgi:hypothetical protein
MLSKLYRGMKSETMILQEGRGGGGESQKKHMSCYMKLLKTFYDQNCSQMKFSHVSGRVDRHKDHMQHAQEARAVNLRTGTEDGRNTNCTGK